MDKNAYILKNIQKLFGLHGCLFDDKGEQFFLTKEENIEVKKCFLEVKKFFDTQGCIVSVYNMDTNIYFSRFLLPNKFICIIGPIGGEKLSNQQIKAFLYRTHIKELDLEIPRFSLSQMITLISTMYCMMTGEIIQEQAITENNIEDLEYIGISYQEMIEYQMYKLDEEKAVPSYKGEKEFFRYIEEGKVSKIKELYLSDNIYIIEKSLESIGTVSVDSDYKQIEYMVVVMIALAARSAMKGGVRTELCYNLSDLYLQKISVCTNIIGIREIGKKALIQFSELVKEKKKMQSDNILIEQCIDYIAKRIFDGFTIEHMSKEFAVNRSYLSSLFTKEMGMSISAYIQKERLHIACNMLKYSEFSIGKIAEYLQFSSASRFGKFFKREYQLTPREYRRKYKPNEFIPTK